MTKQDLEILPPAVSLMIRDVMHRCRESPPSNWPMRAYELIDRQDLAALDKHLKSPRSREYVDGEMMNYSVKDPEQDDGMGFDDTVCVFSLFSIIIIYYYEITYIKHFSRL